MSPAPDRIAANAEIAGETPSPRGLLRREGPAVAAIASVTIAVEIGAYLLARRMDANVRTATLTALAAVTGWTALLAPAMAAGARRALPALLRGGVVADASGVALLVLWGVSPFVTLLAAVKVYCILAAMALFAVASVCVARTRTGRYAAAVVAALVLVGALASPFWIGGILAVADGSARELAAGLAVWINPFYGVTSAVAGQTGFVWHQASVMYEITRLGDFASPPPASWYAPAVLYAALAGGLAVVALARGRGTHTLLESTFCHIPGVGAKTERKLWSAGVDCWSAVRRAAELPLSPSRADAVRRVADESTQRLTAGDARYFAACLPTSEQWRMFREFGDAIAYLDIETTGLTAWSDSITTIVLYDGRTIRHYVQNENLADFRDDIDAYSTIVTFNGKTFDVPFIRRFLGIPMPHAHIDLRNVLAACGYRGGLKAIERQIGIDRHDLADVDGNLGVMLWWDWHNNRNAKALETLLAYNALDVVNLATLMPLAYNMKLDGTPFASSHRSEVPDPPPVPFTPDRETIERVRRDMGVF